MIKDGIREIIGKTITGVLAKKSDGPPKAQLFLMFSDGTYYEIYSSVELSSCGGLDRGGREDVVQYMGETTHVVFESWDPNE